MNMNNVISLSGGKDSTAMLLMMLERKEPVHSAVFFDTGWEFPEMYSHVDLLERRTGIKIWRLQSRLPFDYWLTARPIIARKGPKKGQLYKTGNGWPSNNFRWCTREKVQTIDCFCKPISGVVQCVGYAADENRTLSNPKFSYRFPLQEYGIAEADALQYCYDQGYHWDGLYEHFKRASCFCCPLQGLNELRNLRHHYPELWERMLNMDRAIQNNRGFKHYATVQDLEQRFSEENRQLELEINKSPRSQSAYVST